MFKRKSINKEIKKEKNENIESDPKTQHISTQQFESAIDNLFFYTNDKFFDNLDMTMIINEILQSYPDLVSTNTDTQIKHEFLNMLQNVEYVNSLLDQYSLTMNDFLKIMCKSYGTIFKGMFLKKVKALLELYEF